MSALLAQYLPEIELILVKPLEHLNVEERKTLLLVDDDPIILANLKKQAEKYYHKIYCFESAEKARLFIRNTEVRFDTVLLDYFLPGDSGNAIVVDIKKKDGARVYLMTGDLANVPLKDVKDFDACLPKPLRSKLIKEIFSN
jgi:DNA-binding NtrC family response regulator